jgi:hypothetical protein
MRFPGRMYLSPHECQLRLPCRTQELTENRNAWLATGNNHGWWNHGARDVPLPKVHPDSFPPQPV